MCDRIELKCKVNPSVQLSMERFLTCKGIDFSILSSEDRIKLVNKLELACKSCDLHYQGGNVASSLRPDSQYVFIGRSPNRYEQKDKVLFAPTNNCGSMFQQYIKYLGIEQNSYSIINMCSCGDLHNSPVTPYQISQCSCLTKLALDSLPHAQVFFPMSRDAISWMLGRDVDVMSVLGDVYISEYNGREVVIVPLPHPANTLADRSLIDTTRTILEYVRENIIRKEKI